MGPRHAIVNVDDPYGRRLAEEFEALTFSADGRDADFSARDATFDATGARFAVGGVEVRTRLPGHFNVANALAAFAATSAMGIEEDAIARALAGASAPPAGSSRSTWASRSPFSSTTPTPPTRSTTSWRRRGG